MHPDTVAGVDVGGTKTHVRISRDGAVLVDRVVPTTDWRQRDNRTDAGALVALVTEGADPLDASGSAPMAATPPRTAPPSRNPSPH